MVDQRNMIWIDQATGERKERVALVDHDGYAVVIQRDFLERFKKEFARRKAHAEAKMDGLRTVDRSEMMQRAGGAPSYIKIREGGQDVYAPATQAMRAAGEPIYQLEVDGAGNGHMVEI